MNRIYETPLAFKQALEHRLRSASSTRTDISRRRQLVVFERFLARVVRVLGDVAVLDDFMLFNVVRDKHRPAIRVNEMMREAIRFRARCTIAAKIYGHPFGVDIGFEDPILGEPDVIVADDTLGFAGVAPPTLRLYPLESHLAEKLHAYTLPRARSNTRVKDLPDLALPGTTRAIDARRLRAAFEKTFSFRATHDIPTLLPSPPNGWRETYAALANEDELPWQDAPRRVRGRQHVSRSRIAARLRWNLEANDMVVGMSLVR